MAVSIERKTEQMSPLFQLAAAGSSSAQRPSSNTVLCSHAAECTLFLCFLCRMMHPCEVIGQHVNLESIDYNNNNNNKCNDNMKMDM